jgi:hypothetical protein
MFEVFSRAKGHRPELWAATDGSDCPLALLLPIKVTLMGGLLRPVSTRAVAYGSVLCAPGPGLSTLLETYNREQRGALFTELRNLSDLGSLQPLLEENGFIYEDHLNYLVDLDRPADMVLQNMGRRTRKQIRRALRQAAVAIEEASQHDQVQICYRLLQKSYDAAQVPLADYSLFEATFDVLHARGMVKFLLARLEDEYIAGSVELIYKDTIYGWYAANISPTNCCCGISSSGEPATAIGFTISEGPVNRMRNMACASSKPSLAVIWSVTVEIPTSVGPFGCI